MSQWGGGVGTVNVKEVANSPAFTILDELYRDGKISLEQSNEYKKKYEELHEVVLSTYGSETSLLNRAKELNTVYQSRRKLLEKKTEENKQNETSLKKLREQLSASSQELTEYDDRRNMVRFEQEELERSRAEKENILKEKRRKMMMDIEPEVARLTDKINEIKVEVDEIHSATEKEKTSTKELLDQTNHCNDTIRELDVTKQDKRKELKELKLKPDHWKNQVKLLQSAKVRFDEEAQRLDSEINGYESKLNVLQEKRKEKENERLDLGYKLEMLRAAIDKRQRNVEDIKQALEEEKERNSDLLEARAKTEWERKEQSQVFRNAKDFLSVLKKECDKTKKKFEKLRRKKSTVEGVLPPLIHQQKQLEAEIRTMEVEFSQKKRELSEFKKDEELFIAEYLAQEQMEEDARKVLEGVQAESVKLEKKLEELFKEEHSLKRVIDDLEGQREKMARAASQATGSAREMRETLKVHELVLLDLDKQLAETVTSLGHCSKLYEVVKNQRNKFANLTQGSAQALAEMREKIKVLTNEVDILRSESISRDGVLSEEVRIHNQGKNARDASRVEQSRLHNKLRVLKEKEHKQLLEIGRLNSIINKTEKEMLRLRQMYSRAVDNRNMCGIQLIDRNDELCIIYEKKNIHESVQNRGEVALQEMEDEMRFLQLETAEIERKIELKKRQLPSHVSYETARTTLRTLQKQLASEKKLTKKLTKNVESPAEAEDDKEEYEKTGDRSRQLGGLDPEPQQLKAKIEVLEERLNDTKEQLLEKELILDEVTTLSDKLRVQASESRGSTLEVAKRINDLQSKIRTITRQMMAVVSELSMYQATCMKLEQERDHKEGSLKQATGRMAEGLPPTDDAEHEWFKMERNRFMRHQAVLNRTRYQEELTGELDATAQTLVRTTASVRPNAYIEEQFGIPKPYGGKAPFKPSQLGASMRHIRKPVVREIEL